MQEWKDLVLHAESYCTLYAKESNPPTTMVSRPIASRDQITLCLVISRPTFTRQAQALWSSVWTSNSFPLLHFFFNFSVWSVYHS